MKIDLEEIWHTKVAMTNVEVAGYNELLEDIGIEPVIEDEDVRYDDYWVPYRWIKCVQAAGDGFNITLTDGDIVFSKENPFDKE